MKARTSALTALALGAATAGIYLVASRVRAYLSFYDFMDAFTYKLGQVSGMAFGRMDVAASDAVGAQDALGLTQFEMNFSIELDINDKRARWAQARFRTVKRIGAVGQVHATIRGDSDSLIRLARWLRSKPYSLFTEVSIKEDGVVLEFCMSDEHFDDVRQLARKIRNRVHTDPELDGAVPTSSPT